MVDDINLNSVLLFVTIAFQVVSTVSILVTLWMNLKNRDHMNAIKVELNGRMTQLLRETEAAAEARGNLAGRAALQSEQTQ